VCEWWEVLGVPAGASPSEIRAAFRNLASQHHPDKGGDPRRMAEINEAYAKALP
jgi:curved DNA-binding protein CbpA